MAPHHHIFSAIIAKAEGDGPLAFDNAVNLKATEIKHIHSPVASFADVLVVHGLEAGNMLTGVPG